MNIVAFEGIDGSGKTTLIKSLLPIAKEHKIKVKHIANPSNSAKYTFAKTAQKALQHEVHHPITEAMIYASVVMENQKTYINGDYDLVLLDRCIYSTFAYNVFYPYLNNFGRFNADKICNALIEMYLQCDFRYKGTPQIFIMLQSSQPINDKHLPLDYQCIIDSYSQARPYMEKLYDRMGHKFLQFNIDPSIGPEETRQKAEKIILGL